MLILKILKNIKIKSKLFALQIMNSGISTKIIVILNLIISNSGIVFIFKPKLRT